MAIPFLRMGTERKKTLSSFWGSRPTVRKLGSYGFSEHVPQGQASREAEDEVLTERFQRSKHQHKNK